MREERPPGAHPPAWHILRGTWALNGQLSARCHSHSTRLGAGVEIPGVMLSLLRACCLPGEWVSHEKFPDDFPSPLLALVSRRSLDRVEGCNTCWSTQSGERCPDSTSSHETVGAHPPPARPQQLLWAKAEPLSPLQGSSCTADKICSGRYPKPHCCSQLQVL